MYLHGECVIAEIAKLPENLKARNDKDSIMIAESITPFNWIKFYYSLFAI